jgi:hypothetical protein
MLTEGWSGACRLTRAAQLQVKVKIGGHEQDGNFRYKAYADVC